MVKLKDIPSQDGMRNKTVADYFQPVKQTKKDKNEGKRSGNEEISAILEEIITNDNNNGNIKINQTEEATKTSKAYTETTEEKDKDELEVGKNEGKNKEDAENSEDEAEEEDESEDEVTKNDAVEDQQSYCNDGTEKVTNMGTDTVTTNGGVSLKNNMDGPEKKAGEKAESNKAPVEEKTEPKINENDNETKLNTETEEATSMGADTEVIGGSGLRQHVERFHERGATAARTEDNNIMEEIGSIKGTIDGGEVDFDDWDKWESDDVEEKNTMDEDEKLIQQQRMQIFQRRI